MILVSDTSVLIELERGGLLEAVFALPHAERVPAVSKPRGFSKTRDKYHLNPLVVKLGCLEPGDPSGVCSHISTHVFSMRSHIFLFFRVEGP